jgi:protein-S-isoprenylcysteine O-methyltransferase Ste14
MTENERKLSIATRIAIFVNYLAIAVMVLLSPAFLFALAMGTSESIPRWEKYLTVSLPIIAVLTLLASNRWSRKYGTKFALPNIIVVLMFAGLGLHSLGITPLNILEFGSKLWGFRE